MTQAGPVQIRLLSEVEAEEIRLAFAAFGGHRTRMSEALGISKASLWRKLKMLDMPRGRIRREVPVPVADSCTPSRT